jgi:twitching motility protein PilT
MRLHGDLVPLRGYGELEPAELERMVYAILRQGQREQFEQEMELDVSYSLPGRARFRVNVYRQRDSVGAALRLVPAEIPSLEELGLPTRVAEFAREPRGLVLVTGPTGSGKSTTLAGLINANRACHIVTIEDPIEYLHDHKTAMVSQREIGGDTRSFSEALRRVLRQDPDVILIGEMRDPETIATALTAAETGHLVFATLHTQSAPQTIDRIVDAFPADQQAQVRAQLSTTLRGVVTQQLLPTTDGKGRVVAAEVMVMTPAIAHMIREAKTGLMFGAIQMGGRDGMQTMDAALVRLVRSGQISRAVAVERAQDEGEVTRLAG